MKAMIVSDLHLVPTALGSLFDGKKLRRTTSCRFFDQSVLTGLDGSKTDFREAVVLGRNDDNIHVVIDHVAPLRRRLGACLLAQGARAGAIDVCDQCHFMPTRPGRTFAADQSATHDADFHGSLPQPMPRSLGTMRRNV